MPVHSWRLPKALDVHPAEVDSELVAGMVNLPPNALAGLRPPAALRYELRAWRVLDEHVR